MSMHIFEITVLEKSQGWDLCLPRCFLGALPCRFPTLIFWSIPTFDMKVIPISLWHEKLSYLTFYLFMISYWQGVEGPFKEQDVVIATPITTSVTANRMIAISIHWELATFQACGRHFIRLSHSKEGPPFGTKAEHPCQDMWCAALKR